MPLFLNMWAALLHPVSHILIYPQAKHNYGLIDRSYETDQDFDPQRKQTQWQRFAYYVNHLRSHSSPTGADYRVLYLGRHGQGYHNVAESYFGTVEWDVSCFFCLFSLCISDIHYSVILVFSRVSSDVFASRPVFEALSSTTVSALLHIPPVSFLNKLGNVLFYHVMGFPPTTLLRACFPLMALHYQPLSFPLELLLYLYHVLLMSFAHPFILRLWSS